VKGLGVEIAGALVEERSDQRCRAALAEASMPPGLTTRSIVVANAGAVTKGSANKATTARRTIERGKADAIMLTCVSPHREGC
jgi:hypothetical protein